MLNSKSSYWMKQHIHLKSTVMQGELLIGRNQFQVLVSTLMSYCRVLAIELLVQGDALRMIQVRMKARLLRMKSCSEMVLK